MDMVVTLHACDTATDYALAKAVEWGAEVILSVPCCQHEVNKQIKNEMLEPVLRYGILKERMSALITDAVRADLLESKGYDTQILEFIDMEHTPKNLLIRAVRTGKRSDQGKVEKMLAALNIHPTLDRLLNEKEQEKIIEIQEAATEQFEDSVESANIQNKKAFVIREEDGYLNVYFGEEDALYMYTGIAYQGLPEELKKEISN